MGFSYFLTAVSLFLVFSVDNLVEAQNCNADNVLRALRRQGSSATSFCKNFIYYDVPTVTVVPPPGVTKPPKPKPQLPPKPKQSLAHVPRPNYLPPKDTFPILVRTSPPFQAPRAIPSIAAKPAEPIVRASALPTSPFPGNRAISSLSTRGPGTLHFAPISRIALAFLSSSLSTQLVLEVGASVA
ncbi:hypothetical protein MMC22_000614 [Lobaria immixta]|nr:hypothetical protein [Lobaria immixta]